MSSPKQMPFTLSVPTDVSQLPGQFLGALGALVRLNVDACSSALTGAALHWESVLSAQTPEQFVRRQADVIPWLTLQIAAYTRGWMDIASETTRLSAADSHHDDGHEREQDAMSAGLPAGAKADAMMRGAVPMEVQPDGECVAGTHVGEMVRAILERAAKATPDTEERRSTPRARRSSSR